MKSDYQTSNGVIHHIDTLLTPYKLEGKPQLEFKTVRRVHLRLINVKSEQTASYPCLFLDELQHGGRAVRLHQLL